MAKLEKIEIKDDFPLMVALYGKSSWKKDKNGKIIVKHLLNRQADSCTITPISCAELKPSADRNRLIEVLRYFFSVCDEGLSPQSLWASNDCDYKSLLKDFDMGKNKQFDTVFDKIITLFPELKQPENFLEEISKGESLRDVVSEIEVAYPETWTVEYTKEK